MGTVHLDVDHDAIIVIGGPVVASSDVITSNDVGAQGLDQLTWVKGAHVNARAL
jgi:hypothetical protein